VVLEVQALSAGYANRPVLRGVGLRVSPGTVLAVVGPNGSGKSTLVKAVAGLLPFEGRVLLEGEAVRPSAIGYMPQDVQAPASLTVVDVVLLGRIGRLRLKVTAADLDAVQQALESLGVADLAGRYLGELSGGQRQLVFLAQALVAQPQVLLLDEPISALDISHQLEVLQLVKSLTLARGLRTIMVLHDLNAASRFASQVALLSRGELLALGTPSEVLTTARIARAFGVETEALRSADGHPVLLPLRALPR
jgi:iron complex transport system ATP-binding protein